MILTGDYHTHTVYSHGKGTIEQSATVAKERGLKEICISDHGFSHPIFGLTKRKLPKMRQDIKEATEKTGVKILLGIESNFIGTDGTVDLKAKDYDKFDTFLAGMHKLVLFKVGTLFSTGVPNLFYSFFKDPSVPKSLIDRNTKTYINVIKKNPIDVLTHVGFCCPCNVVEVAKALADYGTYLELNAKKTHLTDEELFAVSQTGVRFLINSDAHSPDRVGEISLVEKALSRISFPLEKIDNIEGRSPKFRFSAFKGER